MTGYTVHTGSTVKFSSGWDNIFQTAKSSKKSTGSQREKLPATGKSTRKTVVKSVKEAVKKVAHTKSAKAIKKKTVTKSVKRGK